MSRAAMQQALAYIEEVDYGPYDKWPVIIALKQALAEPEQIEDAIVYGSAWSKDGKRIDPMSVYKEPEQEPVAWMFQHEETGRTMCVDAQQVEWGFEKGNPRLKKIAPLYTAPTPRKPLSEDQIVDIWAGVSIDYDDEINIIELARAIERHHGIGDSNAT